LEDFIKSIATALDRKSKYTGGHIQRVATLAEMITQKIQNEKTRETHDANYERCNALELSCVSPD
jgi:HD-GYP domain-containing protein (c-di-GMP phosphodiesterase class II)